MRDLISLIADFCLLYMAIRILGFHLNNKTIILGELHKAHWINAIILITKKVIFNARTGITIPTFDSIKNQVKNIYKYEKYKYTL